MLAWTLGSSDNKKMGTASYKCLEIEICVLRKKHAYWLWCCNQYRVCFDPRMLQPASNALWLQSCITLKQNIVSTCLEQLAIQIYTTLTLYEVCLYFGCVGRVVTETFIHHTFLDASKGKPAEFTSQLANFQWPNYFSSFPKVWWKKFPEAYLRTRVE